MKKTLIKSLTVITLVVCLLTALVGCNNDNGGSNNTPGTTTETLNELKHPFLVSEEDTAKAEEFFKAFVTPYENKTGDLLLKNSSTIAIDANVKLFIDLDVQAIVNIDANKEMNLKEVYFYFNAHNAKTVAESTEKTIGNVYFKNNGLDTDSVILSINMKDGSTINKNIVVGNINKYIEKAKTLGTPSFDTFFSDLEDLVNGILSKFRMSLADLLGTNIDVIIDQQVRPLLTRMLFKSENSKLVPLFSDNNGVSSLTINTANFNEATSAFFKRGSEIINDETYDPLKDYNTDNKTDTLKNDGDVFFSIFMKESLPGLFDGAKLSFDMGKWASDFKVMNENKDISDPVQLSMNFTKTDKGIENGTISFAAKNGTYVKLPSATNVEQKSNPLTFDVSVVISDINITATAAPQKLDTSRFTNIETVKSQEKENLLKLSVSGKLTGQDVVAKEGVDPKVNIEREYTLTADINPFAFALIDAKTSDTQAKTIVQNAVKEFSLKVVDPTKNDDPATEEKENLVYSVNFVSDGGFVVTYFNNGKSQTEQFDFKAVNKMVKAFRSIITFDNNQSIISKINKTFIVGIIQDLISKKPVKLPSFDKDEFGNILALNIPNGFDEELLKMFKLTFGQVTGKNPQFIDRIFGTNSEVMTVKVTITASNFLGYDIIK